MSNLLELLAIIPARGGSKGIPRKNIKLLNGRPLIHYTIEAALESKCVQDIIVSTDDEEIAAVSKATGINIPYLRPGHLATDVSKTIDVIQYEINLFEDKNNCVVQNVILLQPTSPLRNSFDIDQAYSIYKEKKADSLQSVTTASVHPYLLRKIEEGLLVPFMNGFEDNLRRQDVSTAYQLNGAIYIFRRELLNTNSTLIGTKNYPYIMPPNRSIDIDDIMDFKFAEALLNN